MPSVPPPAPASLDHSVPAPAPIDHMDLAMGEEEMLMDMITDHLYSAPNINTNEEEMLMDMITDHLYSTIPVINTNTSTNPPTTMRLRVLVRLQGPTTAHHLPLGRSQRPRVLVRV